MQVIINAKADCQLIYNYRDPIPNALNNRRDACLVPKYCCGSRKRTETWQQSCWLLSCSPGSDRIDSLHAAYESCLGAAFWLQARPADLSNNKWVHMLADVIYVVSDGAARAAPIERLVNQLKLLPDLVPIHCVGIRPEVCAVFKSMRISTTRVYINGGPVCLSRHKSSVR